MELILLSFITSNDDAIISVLVPITIDAIYITTIDVINNKSNNASVTINAINIITIDANSDDATIVNDTS